MVFEFSAGGIVYKKEDGKILVLVSQHSGHYGWVFPKGRIGDKEENKNQTKEETAIREVEEETGVKGEIEKALNPITYFYVWEGKRIKKTVYYFLMKYIGGDITKHDWEMQAVEWLPKDEVLDRLTYPSDKAVFEEAQKLI
jgi:8-oxo-dGTP diphosphatase